MEKRYQLRPDAVPVVAHLGSPISREELVEIVAAESGGDPTEVFETLRASGLLTEESENAQSAVYTFNYGSIYWHRGMLRDLVRTNGFKKAIKEVVRSGDVVVDVGAGTGILSLFAASAGAGRVISIENTPIIDVAKYLAKVNHLDHRIEFVRTDAKEFKSDVQADVIVSEWMGYFLMEEYMYGAFTPVRDRCLKPGGVVIPSAARLFLAPIHDSRLYCELGPGFWESPVYGYDFTEGKKRQLERLRYVVAEVKHTAIIAEPWNVMSINCYTDLSEAFHFEKSGSFAINRSGPLHGFVGYFDLVLSPKVSLDTSPFARQTHWKQAYFPISQVPVRKGDRLDVTITTTRGGIGPKLVLTGRLVRRGKEVEAIDHSYAGDA